MPLIDCGTTRRTAITPRRALECWEHHAGTCCLCGRVIDGTRERWFIEHVRALELGGSNADDNLAPAHLACKPAKDALDHRRAAKAKRVKSRHLGITKPRRSRLPGGRDSAIRITLHHGPVDRRTGQPLPRRRWPT